VWRTGEEEKLRWAARAPDREGEVCVREKRRGGALAVAATSVTTASAFCAGHAIEPGVTDILTTWRKRGGKQEAVTYVTSARGYMSRGDHCYVSGGRGGQGGLEGDGGGGDGAGKKRGCEVEEKKEGNSEVEGGEVGRRHEDRS
jgi:hypothetical protein